MTALANKENSTFNTRRLTFENLLKSLKKTELKLFHSVV